MVSLSMRIFSISVMSVLVNYVMRTIVFSTYVVGELRISCSRMVMGFFLLLSSKVMLPHLTTKKELLHRKVQQLLLGVPHEADPEGRTRTKSGSLNPMVPL